MTMKIKEKQKNDSTHHPTPDLMQDIKNLEDVVEKLKGALDGRTKL